MDISFNDENTNAYNLNSWTNSLETEKYILFFRRYNIESSWYLQTIVCYYKNKYNGEKGSFVVCNINVLYSSSDIGIQWMHAFELKKGNILFCLLYNGKYTSAEDVVHLALMDIYLTLI